MSTFTLASQPEIEDKEDFMGVVAAFKNLISQNPDIAVAVAGVRALVEVIKKSSASTLMELERELKKAVDLLKKHAPMHGGSSISVASGCEVFTHFVTRTSLEMSDFDSCKMKLIERGEQFTVTSETARDKIVQLGDSFIHDGVVVLTHGYSRVVLSVLKHAAKKHSKRFSVIVTESRPDASGYKTAQKLQQEGVPVTVIIDSAVAHVMGQVDIVLTGAEGVVENGGIINKIGSYQIAIVAKTFKIPFYVAAESYKFTRVYPLNQKDLPNMFTPFQPITGVQDEFPISTKVINPSSDYTPPSYITLLFTDLGVFTPSAVSDELIKLYS